jgi:hypothetical protein
MRANTVTQMEDFLFEAFNLGTDEDEPSTEAIREAEAAIQQVRVGKSHVDLKPQPAHLRRRQHDLARQSNLISHSYGTEPNRYVRVFGAEADGR